MSNTDDVITPAQLPPLMSEPWRPIDPSYKSVLRISVLLNSLFPLIGCGALMVFNPDDLAMVGRWVGLAIVLLLLFLLFVWVPRRVARTQYLLRERDVHKRTGYWWHATVSAGHNRIQHIEVTQGPLERLFGLSKLVLFTAGGGQSDVKIPGLPTDTAHRLKAYLTEKIVSEEPVDDPSE